MASAHPAANGMLQPSMYLLWFSNSTLQEILSHLMGANIGGIDVAHRVSRNTGCRSARSHSTEVARIWNEREQRPIDGIADHDATPLTGLHLRRSVSSGRLVAQRNADINLVIRA